MEFVLKWGASSRYSFGTNSACGSIETTTTPLYNFTRMLRHQTGISSRFEDLSFLIHFGKLYAIIGLIHFQNTQRTNLKTVENITLNQFWKIRWNWIKMIFSTIFKLDQSYSSNILKVDQTDFRLQVSRSGSKCLQPR